MFLNKNTHEQVAIFNDIIMNIFSNYIPNKYVTTEIPMDDRKNKKLNQFKKVSKSETDLVKYKCYQHKFLN